MPNFEWNMNYHTRQITEIIESKRDVLSKNAWELTYVDNYVLLMTLRDIASHNTLMIDELEAHKKSTPKSKLGKILAILRS